MEFEQSNQGGARFAVSNDLSLKLKFRRWKILFTEIEISTRHFFVLIYFFSDQSEFDWFFSKKEENIILRVFMFFIIDARWRWKCSSLKSALRMSEAPPIDKIVKLKIFLCKTNRVVHFSTWCRKTWAKFLVFFCIDVKKLWFSLKLLLLLKMIWIQ